MAIKVSCSKHPSHRRKCSDCWAAEVAAATDAVEKAAEIAALAGHDLEAKLKRLAEASGWMGAAETLGVSHTTLRRWIAEGLLSAKPVAVLRAVRFPDGE